MSKRIFQNRPIVTLTSANMGDVDEVDFDLWAAFVAETIDAATGIEVGVVEQLRFGAPDCDRVDNATHEQREAIRAWLSNEGWEAFCGEEWTSRRQAYDAVQIDKKRWHKTTGGA